MEIKCRENLEVEIHHHPHYQSLNEKLMDDLSNLSLLDYRFIQKSMQLSSNIKGSQLGLSGHPQKPKGVDLIENWVEQIIKNRPQLGVPVDINFTTWVARLDRGQETVEHNHLFYSTYAFVYFVNAPKGASPLVFPTSGKRIKAEPGKLVLFPASLRHKVPVNKCHNRLTIVSNITSNQKK